MNLSIEEKKEAACLTSKLWREANKEHQKKYAMENRERKNANRRRSTSQNLARTKKVGKKCSWKIQGVICDFEGVYTHYINCKKCEYCDEEFINDKDRCLDHDHSIIDKNNVRGVLCRKCNFLDVLNIYNVYLWTI